MLQEISSIIESNPMDDNSNSRLFGEDLQWRVPKIR
jgi:hypothetical protein